MGFKSLDGDIVEGGEVECERVGLPAFVEFGGGEGMGSGESG